MDSKAENSFMTPLKKVHTRKYKTSAKENLPPNVDRNHAQKTMTIFKK